MNCSGDFCEGRSMDEWPPDSGEYMCGGCGREEQVNLLDHEADKNADTYEGERVTYSCGTVLFIERVSPRSFVDCKNCGANYPFIVSSERARHSSGACADMERQKIEPVKTKGVTKRVINSIPFYGGEEE